MDNKERSELLKKTAVAANLRDSFRPIPEDMVKKYYEELSIPLTYDSNAIEGNNISLNETELILKEGVYVRNRNLREHLDIVGYQKAFFRMSDAVSNQEPMTKELLTELHTLVNMGESSENYHIGYRSKKEHDVEIVGRGGIVYHTPPTSKDIAILMDNYLNNLNKDLDEFRSLKEKNPDNIKRICEGLAQHHLDFETIHPFVDGNGRTGRLLLDYEMMNIGLTPVNIKNRDRPKYTTSLYDYQHQGQQPGVGDGKEDMSDLILVSLEEQLDQWNRTFASFGLSIQDEKRSSIGLDEPKTVLKNKNNNIM